jgi:hypothetical protein
MSVSNATDQRLYVLRTRWEQYVDTGTFDHFIEFTVAVNSLTEYFSRIRLPGLVRFCEALENSALARLGEPGSHPLDEQSTGVLLSQINQLLDTISSSRHAVAERRTEDQTPGPQEPDWIKPRSVWLVVSHDMYEMAKALRKQLNFFGIRTQKLLWEEISRPTKLRWRYSLFPARTHQLPTNWPR